MNQEIYTENLITKIKDAIRDKEQLERNIKNMQKELEILFLTIRSYQSLVAVEIEPVIYYSKSDLEMIVMPDNMEGYKDEDNDVEIEYSEDSYEEINLREHFEASRSSFSMKIF